MSRDPTSAADSSSADERREITNVLVVTIDCLRADSFQAAIDEGLVSTLSDLADEGVQFTNAYTVANATDPSLTSMMTGLYPHSHGVTENGWTLDDDVTVLAEIASAGGFWTFGVPSVDHLNDEHSGLGRGFDTYYDSSSYDTLYPILSRIFDLNLFNRFFNLIKDRSVRGYTVKQHLRDTGVMRLHCRTGESVNEDVRTELDDVEPPFFGWIHYFDMHEPRNASRELTAEYDEYRASMHSVDRYVGDVLDQLRSRDLLEETLVVLTADHGESLGERGYTGHGRALYESEVHVPLVFSHRSLPASEVDAVVRTIDVMPTVLDLLDLDVPAEIDGQSLADAIRERGSVDDREVFMLAYPEFSDARAIRSGRWKFIREGDSRELYDIDQDPTELSNLVGDPDYEATVETLERQLEECERRGDEGEDQSVDEDVRDMLEDLGYV